MEYTVNIMSLVNLLVIIIGGIAGWMAFRARVDTVLANQKELMDKLTERFERHEASDTQMFQGFQVAITHLVGDVSRLIGRYESAPRIMDNK